MQNMQGWEATTCVIHRGKNFIAQLVKVLQYPIPGRKIGLLMFACLCLHSVCERADDVSCLRDQGAQRYANTYIDRQVGKTIKTLGRTFLGPKPSTEYINKFRPLNLMIAIRM